MKPSRTYSLAKHGLTVLSLSLLGVLAILGFALVARPDLVVEIAELAGYTVGAVAVVSTGGAGAVGLRHWGAAEGSSSRMVIGGEGDK